MYSRSICPQHLKLRAGGGILVRSAVNKQHPHAATEEPEMNEQNARAAAVNALGGFIKKNAVMCIAFIAAAITCFIASC